MGLRLHPQTGPHPSIPRDTGGFPIRAFGGFTLCPLHPPRSSHPICFASGERLQKAPLTLQSKRQKKVLSVAPTRMSSGSRLCSLQADAMLLLRQEPERRMSSSSS